MTKQKTARGSDSRARTAHAGLLMTFAVACIAGPGAAFAQDGVTLYGVIDEFAQYVNTGNGYTAAINSGGVCGSNCAASSAWRCRLRKRASISGEVVVGSGICSTRAARNGVPGR